MEYGNKTTEEDYDAQLEHLVDACNMSYVEARAYLGSPPYEMIKTEYDSIEVAMGRQATKTLLEPLQPARISDSEAVGLIDDPQRYLTYYPKSDAQMRIDTIGRERVRKAMVA